MVLAWPRLLTLLVPFGNGIAGLRKYGELEADHSVSSQISDEYLTLGKDFRGFFSKSQ